MSGLSDAEKLRRFEKALEYGGGTHSVADVVQLVKDGKAQFWERGSGSIVTEIHTFPRKRAVHFWLLSGDLHDVLALEEDVNAWAVDNGCTLATAVGRRGWGRVSHRTGWREWWPTFQKVLVP